MKDKYLLRTRRVRPTRGTVEGSVHKQRLLAGEQKSREKTTHHRPFVLVAPLTERLLDVLLSRVDLRQKLLEKLEASSEPQQSLGGRVAHLRDLHLHLVQHDGL